MSRMILWTLLGPLLVAAALGAGALSYRAWRQHEGEAAASIRTPNGIDEALFVKVDGMDQWITIRGRDRTNPVLLIVDGGPGAATSALIPSAWESDFVVVCWDQPGAGRTFGRAGRMIAPGLTIDGVALVGEGVADQLRKRLHRHQVGLLATSWGTIVGVEMAKQRPDLFYAYVGTGQLVNLQRGEALNYAHVLAKARERGDRSAVAELEKIGAPPYDAESKLGTQRKWAAAYESGAPSVIAVVAAIATAPRNSLGDLFDWIGGFVASQDHFFGPTMRGPLMAVDLTRLGGAFAVPMFVFQGTQDDFAPFELAKAWFESVSAPEKLFVAAPGAGHYAFMTRSGDLRRLLLDRVRPLGLAADAK